MQEDGKMAMGVERIRIVGIRIFLKGKDSTHAQAMTAFIFNFSTCH
jgi:hypothetical protein